MRDDGLLLVAFYTKETKVISPLHAIAIRWRILILI